jgi:general secretion pathway protein L
MSDTAALIYALPAAAASPGWAAPWWLIDAGQVIARGQGDDWPDLAEGTLLLALAPASDCPVDWLSLPGLTARQAQAAARLQAAEARIDGAALHLVAGPPDGERVPVAAVSHSVMQGWARTAAPMIIPAAMLLATDGDAMADSGGERLLRIGDRVIALDDQLAEAMLAGRDVATLSDSTVDARLAELARTPPLNLRAGPYASARPGWFDGAALHRAALLVAAILLVSLAMGLVRLARVHADVASVDSATAAAASEALGRPVTADGAAAELDQRLTAIGVSRGSAAATLAAIMTAMEGHPAVAIDAASWDRNGTLTITLGATSNTELNPVLTAVQAAGYRITAQPRTGSDGRALVDMTMRGEP